MPKEDLTVMIVDSSARAHAVSEAYERSPNVQRILITPGNDFIGYGRKKEVIVEKNAKLTDPNSFLAVAQKYRPGLIDVCQDDALALGTADLLKEHGFAVFGPTRAAARLEWDKAWSRDFMSERHIPHPEYAIFDSPDAGINHVTGLYERNASALVFIKAAGLCAGKGAIGAKSLDEAIAAITAMKNFGSAGQTYLIEEGMVGEEASIYAFSDGRTIRPVRAAQDHKRLNNFDEGPNTGGMGAVSPIALLGNGVSGGKLNSRIFRDIVFPAIQGMEQQGNPYIGVLYTSIMVVEENGQLIPKVVEFNARWGAPEAEVVVPGIKTPMDKIVYACINGTLDKITVEEDNKTRVCVVGASRGYPGDISAVKGKRIFGLEDAMAMQGITLYGAGIAVRDGRFYANGGRLFSLVAEGGNIKDARAQALAAMALISIEGNNLHYRTDIGWRDMERHNVLR